MSKPIFRSAVTGTDGEVDAGYLALFWIMAVVITAIPFMCLGAAIQMWLDPAHRFDVQALGIGIGSVCGGFGVAVGAVGAFRMGDKRYLQGRSRDWDEDTYHDYSQGRWRRRDRGGDRYEDNDWVRDWDRGYRG